MNWMDMTQRDFLAALASSSPTPGGGTASAVALGQASALSIMVADLTLNNEKWSDGWPVAERIQHVAIPLMRTSGDLAQQDSDAFDGVMASFQLPKGDDDEVAERRAAIRAATLHAAEVPYETACKAAELLSMLPELAAMGNANAVSDVGVAGLLASAAAKGALFNVDINLNSLPAEMGATIRNEIDSIKDQVRTDGRRVMEAVRERLDA